MQSIVSQESLQTCVLKRRKATVLSKSWFIALEFWSTLELNFQHDLAWACKQQFERVLLSQPNRVFW